MNNWSETAFRKYHKRKTSPIKECGECFICCDVYVVRCLNKLAWVKCPYHINGKCSTYETRSQTCRDYFCDWIVGEIDDEYYPAKCGFTIRTMPLFVGIVLRETNVDYELLRKISNEMVSNGLVVGINSKEDYSFVFPDGGLLIYNNQKESPTTLLEAKNISGVNLHKYLNFVAMIMEYKPGAEK